MFSFFYDLCLHVYALFCLRKLLTWKKFPKIEKNGRELIWIHAVSFGETKAVAPLIRRFKALENPPLIVLSTITKTGHAAGLKTEADFPVYLPFDLSYIIRPIIKRIAPDLVILTETDFWYQFQRAAKKIGAKLVLINGKISERSFKRHMSLPFLRRRLFEPFDLCCVQGQLYHDRFRTLGIPESKLKITGNIKLDVSEASQTFIPSREHLGVKDCFVLTLGSTHPPEERIWMTALKQLWLHYPNLKVIIAPRHPERFAEVGKLIASETLPFGRWSERETLHERNILLVDEMGALREFYKLSDVAFVGGSFTPKVGGHNILEPAYYGKPVLFGPYMHSQPDFLELVKTYRVGLQITPEEIFPTMHKFISTPTLCSELGDGGLQLITESRGALDKTERLLLSLLQKPVP